MPYSPDDFRGLNTVLSSKRSSIRGKRKRLAEGHHFKTGHETKRSKRLFGGGETGGAVDSIMKPRQIHMSEVTWRPPSCSIP